MRLSRDTFTSSIRLIGCLLAAAAMVCACGGRREVHFSGRTMGTTYHITVITGRFDDTGNLTGRIEKRLEDINDSMSTYRPRSEISRFNRLNRTGVPFPMSRDLSAVMHLSQRIVDLSDGAWDPTVKPCVDLWGFGTDGVIERMPTPGTVAAAVKRVGFGHIDITTADELVKHRSDVSLDLASIAKGYGVDAISALIRDSGYPDHLVEIGGEVVAAGKRIDGHSWRIGINQPDPEAALNRVYRAVDISNAAFATSGDYRSFYVMDGKRYSHVIDPRTGYPVSNGVVSASVMAPTCAMADALATAVMVMGAEKGLSLINRMDHVEALIVTRDDDRLVDHPSRGFYAHLAS